MAQADTIIPPGVQGLDWGYYRNPFIVLIVDLTELGTAMGIAENSGLVDALDYGHVHYSRKISVQMCGAPSMENASLFSGGGGLKLSFYNLILK